MFVRHIREWLSEEPLVAKIAIRPTKGEGEENCENAECDRSKLSTVETSYLLELLNSTLVDTTALVDQVWLFVSVCGARQWKEECLRPVVVDLPESTWPITTTLMCIFSLLNETC